MVAATKVLGIKISNESHSYRLPLFCPPIVATQRNQMINWLFDYTHNLQNWGQFPAGLIWKRHVWRLSEGEAVGRCAASQSSAVFRCVQGDGDNSRCLWCAPRMLSFYSLLSLLMSEPVAFGSNMIWFPSSVNFFFFLIFSAFQLFLLSPSLHPRSLQQLVFAWCFPLLLNSPPLLSESLPPLLFFAVLFCVFLRRGRCLQITSAASKRVSAALSRATHSSLANVRLLSPVSRRWRILQTRQTALL